jgi:hypothetical protein
MASKLSVPEVIMFKSICTLTVIFGLCLGAAATAQAHDRAYDRYPSQYHHPVRIYRGKHMPQRLRHDRDFRTWYRRTSLRHDHHLSWRQLFAIYRWERSYRHGHDRHHHDKRRPSKRKWRHHHDD